MRKQFFSAILLGGIVLFIANGCMCSNEQINYAGEKMKIVDLSIAIEENLPSDPGIMIPEIERWSHEQGLENMLTFFPGATKKDLPGEVGWTVDFLKLSSHSGTHLDAPWHYHPTSEGKKAKTIDEIPLEWCIGDGVVLDFSQKGDGYLVQISDIEEELKRINYQIKQGDIVLIRSGAAPYWGTPEYLVKGCGMGREATLFLTEKGVKIVGTDAWSWDRPLPVISKEFAETKDSSIIWEGHFAGIEKEYCHIEKMTNLDKLPPYGFTVICTPIKIKGGSAGWVRPIAIINEK